MKQMVLNLLIFLLIVGAIYLFAFPDSQLVATASAIRQIWSGSCRLSCRHSEFSGFSGLSGLIPGHQDKICCVTQSNDAGPSTGCICESCPCALIENVLRTCRPAATMYSSAVSLIATCYYSVVDTLTEMYTYVQRVINCRASCQRPQLIDASDSASENIYFGNKDRESVLKAREKTKQSDAGLLSSRSIVFRDISDTVIKCEEGRSSKSFPEDIDLKQGISDATLTPKNEKKVPETFGEVNTCPKCKEKGQVCIKRCPKANLKKK